MNTCDDSWDIFCSFQKGIIPGPQETLEEYQYRAEQSLKDCFEQDVMIENIFGIHCPKFKVLYAQQNLHPTQLALCIVEESTVWIELHPKLEKKSYLYGQNKKNILSHEKLHAMRQKYPHDLWDEFLAYQTSNLWHYQVFGALGSCLNPNLVITCLMIAPLSMLVDDFLGLGIYTFLATYLGFQLLNIYKLNKGWKLLNLIFGVHGPKVALILTQKELYFFMKKRHFPDSISKGNGPRDLLLKSFCKDNIG